ncbi:MAG: rhomboid family intramembrane serine protease [Candidatus Micrarchaeota archaeon]
MFGLRKFPYGSAVLAGIILALYYFLSLGTPYITDSSLRGLALNGQNPLSIISHLFIHVGIFHLIGNLIPLLLFGLALEAAVLSIDVVLIFLMAGTGASLLFSIVNPGVPLIGASAGISGILTSVMLLRPKAALALLIATPLLISFVIFPGIDYAGKWYDSNLASQKVALKEELKVAVEQNKTPEVIMQINQSLEKTQTKIEVTQDGRQREAATPSDFLVHVYGAMIGGFYIYFFKRKELLASEDEFVTIGAFIFGKLDSLQEMLKGKEKGKAPKRKQKSA